MQLANNRNQRVSPVHLVPFTLDDAIRSGQVSGSFQNSSKSLRTTTTINTGGFTFKKEDQRAVSLPEQTRTLELVPFTINETISRPSSSPGRLNIPKKSFQPTPTPPSPLDIVEIQQSESFPGQPFTPTTLSPPSFVDSSFIESISDDPDFQFADPQKGVDSLASFVDEPNFTNINLVESSSINLVGSENLGTRPVRKAQHPSQFR